MSEMVYVKTDETLCWKTMGKTKSQKKKNALALGSLGEQLADDRNKAKRCLSRL